MATFKLPRLKANLAIVNSKGQPLDYFLRLFNIDFAQRIERQEASQDEILQQLSDVQAELAAQVALIQQTLELAGLAYSLAGGTNSIQATGTYDLDSAVPVVGPQVDFIGVSAGDLFLAGSYITATSATRQSQSGEITGEINLIEIDGGVETLIGGPWSFTSNRSSFDPNTPPVILSPVEFNSFELARTNTGDISYRFETILTTPGATLDDVQIRISCRRT